MPKSKKEVETKSNMFGPFGVFFDKFGLAGFVGVVVVMVLVGSVVS